MAELVDDFDANGVPPYNPMFFRAPLGAGSFDHPAEDGSPASIRGEDSRSVVQDFEASTQRPWVLIKWKSRPAGFASSGSPS